VTVRMRYFASFGDASVSRPESWFIFVSIEPGPVALAILSNVSYTFSTVRG